jgi:tetrapyrrole methylase family protein/MazG family protein
MARITVVGIGPGPATCLTKEAEAELLRADKVFFRMGAHPVYEWLKNLGKHVVCFDLLYTTRWTNPEDIYEFMVSALLKEAALRGEAVYAVPGSPDVLEETTNLIRSRGSKEGVEVTVLPGVSFLDQALAETNFDFSLGLQVVLPLTHLQHGFFTNRLALIVCQIEATSLQLDSPRVDLTMKFLLRAYLPDHPVTLIWTDGLPAYKLQSKVMALKDLAREYGEAKFFASLDVPPAG